jgi:hypothetical protein
MGRYAFFNTGIEYKFAFAIQSSEDIRLFGGINNDDYDDPQHAWNAGLDAKLVLARLEQICTLGPYGIPIWDEVPATVEGTYQLKESLRVKYENNVTGKLFYTFLLGCLIYHQLLYTENLAVRYEL